MKKIYSLVMMTAIAMTVNAQQLVIRENFSGYNNGPLSNQGGWVQKGSGADVQVATASPLNRSDYTSGFQYITVGTTDGTDPWKPFSAPIATNANKTIFMSFLVRVTEVAQNVVNAYSIALRDSNSTLANVPCRFYIQEESGPSNDIQFGIAVGSGGPSYTTTAGSYAKGNTYLIVIRYDINTSGVDNAYLWVDPSTTAEPTVGPSNTASFALSTGGEVSYGSAWNVLQVFQSSSSESPNAAYDGFLVAEGPTSQQAWTSLSPAGAPLPVILTSFNAANEGMSTKLIWNTTEESGVASYVIEKSTDGRTFTAIGSVKATSQKVYSFIDASAGGDNSYYRLKMVDIDGAYKYSYIVSIKSKLNTNISLSPNPVTNNLMIQHPKVTTESHIHVINANGQLLRDIKLAANAVISNVDMSGFTSGLYHIVYKGGSDMFTKTVIKQ
jgi:hypothetical protein